MASIPGRLQGPPRGFTKNAQGVWEYRMGGNMAPGDPAPPVYYYDEARGLVYTINNGQKVYGSPVGWEQGYQVPPNSKWNSRTGMWDSRTNNWEKALNIGVGAGLGAGVLNAAGLLGGAAGSSAPSAAATTGGGVAAPSAAATTGGAISPTWAAGTGLPGVAGASSPITGGSLFAGSASPIAGGSLFGGASAPGMAPSVGGAVANGFANTGKGILGKLFGGGKLGNILGTVGDMVGGATQAAGNNRWLENEFGLRASEADTYGKHLHEQDQLNRAKTMEEMLQFRSDQEFDERDRARSDALTANYWQTRKPAPGLKPANFSTPTEQFMNTIGGLGNQAATMLANPATYGTANQPALPTLPSMYTHTPFTPKPMGTGEKVGSYVAPSLGIIGKILSDPSIWTN